MSDIHKAYLKDYKYHVSAGDYDGGACLVKHLYCYKDSDSCSYRWQGVKRAGMAPGKDVYDAHRNPKHRIGKLTPRGYPNVVYVTNFTTGYVPYGNQVHHVLNASSLRKGIDKLTEIWVPIRWVIVNGLLTESYNLNHFENNMILPTKDYHCRETGLPKHYGSHPEYSKKIKTAVTSALKPYEAIANQMKKDKKNHDPLEPEKLKDAFVRISTTMYTNIITLAIANQATRTLMTVNELPPSAFAGL